MKNYKAISEVVFYYTDFNNNSYMHVRREIYKISVQYLPLNDSQLLCQLTTIAKIWLRQASSYWYISSQKKISLCISTETERHRERESSNIIFYWNLKVKTEVTEDISF